MRLSLATWNVHGWVGQDGVRDPSRCLDVIRCIDADAVALQEIAGVDWYQEVRAHGYRPVVSHTIGDFGNALLLRRSPHRVRRLDLSVPGREPRGAILAVVDLGATQLCVVGTHLGLRGAERRYQARRLAHQVEALAASAGRAEPVTVALLGDLNDWTPWGGALRPLVRAVGPLSRVPTFPSHRPMLALDRAAWRGPGLRSRIASVRSAAARRASDHLPLRVDLDGTLRDAA